MKLVRLSILGSSFFILELIWKEICQFEQEEKSKFIFLKNTIYRKTAKKVFSAYHAFPMSEGSWKGTLCQPGKALHTLCIPEV